MTLDTVSLETRSEPATREKLELMLAQAGLELWRSPEGFWAIRIKQVLPKPLPRPRRRRRRRMR